MSSTFINGATYAVSTALGTAIPVSAITNAKPPVLSAAAPPADKSIVVVTSGWPDLNATVARTAAKSTNTFTLENVDTTSVNLFPAGEGAGSVAIASAFIALDQVRNVEMSGGEQQFFDYQYVEHKSGRQQRKPTYKNAMALAITLDYDQSKPWYSKLIELDALMQPVVVRERLPNGAEIYYYAYPSFNKVPTKTLNENMAVVATFSLSADPIRYEGA